jgi:hypothetical protein
MFEFAPVMRANARQARTIRRLHREIEGLRGMVRSTAESNRRLREDIELLALCIPPKRRKVALEFVRDHHDICRLDETPEVEAG